MIYWVGCRPEQHAQTDYFAPPRHAVLLHIEMEPAPSKGIGISPALHLCYNCLKYSGESSFRVLDNQQFIAYRTYPGRS